VLAQSEVPPGGCIDFGGVSVGSYKDTLVSYTLDFWVSPRGPGVKVTMTMRSGFDSAFSSPESDSSFMYYGVKDPINIHIRFTPHATCYYPFESYEFIFKAFTTGDSLFFAMGLEGQGVAASLVSNNDFRLQAPLQLFPNPASSAIMIKYASFEGTSTIVLSDILGRTIREWKLTSFTNGSIPFDVSHLPSGQYNIELVSDRIRQYAKLNVLR